MKTERVLGLMVVMALVASVTVPAMAHTPVPGPNFAGCRTMDRYSAAYAPLPRFVVDELGSEINFSFAQGNYNFCAYADTIYCSLQGVANLAAEVREFAGLVQCLSADINGPLDLDADIPVTPNGMPDGQYELAILAAVLNNPDHALYTQANALYEANFTVLRDLIQEALSVATLKSGDDKNLLPTVKLMAPLLVHSLTGVLAAFATIDDAQTNAALDELLGLLEDIGLAPPEGGIGAITDGIAALGPFGDADGDGFSNFAEYQYFVGEMGYTPAQFVAAALDPAQKPPTYFPEISLSTRTGFVKVGSNVAITIKLSNYYEPPEYVRWYKDGLLLSGEGGLVLSIADAQVEDSGVYRCEVGVLVEEDDKEMVLYELVAFHVLNVGDYQLPTGGALGLALVTGACALAGALGLRRRK